GAMAHAHLRWIAVMLLQSPVREEEVESAVLAHDCVYRPHARDVIAPAGRAAGHRYRAFTGCLQPLERSVRLRGKFARRGEGVIDVKEHRAHGARIELGERFQCPMTCATRWRCASVMCRPHLVRRQSTSSAELAHSRSRKWRTSRSVRPAP